MASHEGIRWLLKTPEGYLTKNGTTNDINDKDIVILNIYGIGGFGSSKETNIKNFLKHSVVNVNENECELLQYQCSGRHYLCSNCPDFDFCEFWKDRTKCRLFKK